MSGYLPWPNRCLLVAHTAPTTKRPRDLGNLLVEVRTGSSHKSDTLDRWRSAFNARVSAATQLETLPGYTVIYRRGRESR